MNTQNEANETTVEIPTVTETAKSELLVTEVPALEPLVADVPALPPKRTARKLAETKSKLRERVALAEQSAAAVEVTLVNMTRRWSRWIAAGFAVGFVFGIAIGVAL